MPVELGVRQMISHLSSPTMNLESGVRISPVRTQNDGYQ